jgi:hypothetical protein
MEGGNRKSTPPDFLVAVSAAGSGTVLVYERGKIAFGLGDAVGIGANGTAVADRDGGRRKALLMRKVH